MKPSFGKLAACIPLGVFVVALCASGAVPAHPAQAAPSKSTVSAAYKAYRSKRCPAARVKIVDVDRNGVVDMLVHDGYEGMSVCTYNKKTRKVIKVKGVATGKGYSIPLLYNASKRQFVLSTYSTGGGKSTVYRLAGTKAKRVKTFTYSNGKFTSDHNPVFRVDGKKVSEAAYDAARAKAVKGFKSLKSPLG